MLKHIITLTSGQIYCNNNYNTTFEMTCSILIILNDGNTECTNLEDQGSPHTACSYAQELEKRNCKGYRDLSNTRRPLS